MAMASALFAGETELYLQIHETLRPKLATPSRPRLDLRTMVLREYGVPSGLSTLVIAPYAGHTAMIADYHRGQS